MVHPAADLVQYMQRRELLAFEQRLARAAYAYGVDLRRARWLDRSTLGEPLMRAVDRRWSELVSGLRQDTFTPEDRPVPVPLMEQVVRIAKLLRAPMPTLRTLRPGVRQQWAAVTPLGTTRGGMHWLALDAEALLAEPEQQRAFLLGAGLAHLQCDHGPMFTAHILAWRANRGLAVVRRLMAPWTRVATFSSDRGGLLAAGSLEVASAVVRDHAKRAPAWFPIAPALNVRLDAMEEFDRSRVVKRLRVLQARATPGDGPSVGPAARPAGEDSDEPPEPTPPEDDGDVKAALEGAWSLARCDERLTRRLGLL